MADLDTPRGACSYASAHVCLYGEHGVVLGELLERALDGLAPSFSRQRKTFDPDLFRLRCQRRLMPAAERQHLDLTAIDVADARSSAPPTAQSMYWSSRSSK